MGTSPRSMRITIVLGRTRRSRHGARIGDMHTSLSWWLAPEPEPRSMVVRWGMVDQADYGTDARTAVVAHRADSSGATPSNGRVGTPSILDSRGRDDAAELIGRDLG
jgi:hypothetical protein